MDQIEKYGLNAKDVGALLVEKAQEDLRKRVLEQASGLVGTLMYTREERQRMIEQSRIIIERCEKRIDAIRAGEFTVSSTGAITFTDPENNLQITDNLPW